MNAIREIVEVKNHRIIVDLPHSFHPKTVEVIVLPLDALEQEPTEISEEQPSVDYSAYFGVTNLGTATIETYLHQIREEWERHVSD